MSKQLFPFLGFGLGLRGDHVKEVLAGQTNVDWFEALSENFMGQPEYGFGRTLKNLELIRKDFPVVLHGVSMNLGSQDPLDLNYFKRLKQLINIIDPIWVSDHLCWTGIHGHNTHDLMPLPYTKASLQHFSNRVQQAQDILGQRILIENPSSYIEFKQSEMTEAEFIVELAEKADCGLLLDVNNIFVSSFNHGFNIEDYLRNIPWHRVGQIHMAGHDKDDEEELLIDTHAQPVRDEVFNLYKKVLKLAGPISTMIERDDNIPPLKELEQELDKARNIYKELYVNDSSRTATTGA